MTKDRWLQPILRGPAISVTRRETISLGIGAAAAAALSPGRLAWAAGDKPRYLRRHTSAGFMPGDFKNHMLDNTENTGGEDYTLVHGIPVVAPCRGKVVYSDYDANSGNVLMIDYGLFDIVYAHMDEIFAATGDDVDRMTVVGTEGRTGRGAQEISHLHISILGNAALVGDLAIDANFDLRDKDNPFSSVNYPVDPKNVCAARGKPLYERPFNPKSDRQFDALYKKSVVELVQHQFTALNDNLFVFGNIPHPITGDPFHEALSGEYFLSNMINLSVYRFGILTGYAYQDMPALQLSQLYGNRKAILRITDKKRGTDSFPNLLDKLQISLKLGNGRVLKPRELVEAAWLAKIFGNVRSIAHKVMLTSPYIDHTNPETIRAVAEANSAEIQSLIYDQDYYGQFLPANTVAESSMETTGQPVANEAAGNTMNDSGTNR